MSANDTPLRTDHLVEHAHDQIAEIDVSVRSAHFNARLRLTPSGLLAIGGLVSGILLSTAVLVWVSTSVAREHPIVTRFRRR